MMIRKALDLWVGFFVALGAGAILFLALWVASSATLAAADGYEVKANFGNIGGLKVRAPVKSAGVVVGRVAEIGFDNETFEAVARFTLDARFRFPRDTSAKILTSGLLGEQYIGLEAGADERMLKDGERLRLTQSAVVLENLIGQFFTSKAAGDGAGKDEQ